MCAQKREKYRPCLFRVCTSVPSFTCDVMRYSSSRDILQVEESDANNDAAAAKKTKKDKKEKKKDDKGKKKKEKQNEKLTKMAAAAVRFIPRFKRFALFAFFLSFKPSTI